MVAFKKGWTKTPRYCSANFCKVDRKGISGCKNCYFNFKETKVIKEKT